MGQNGLPVQPDNRVTDKKESPVCDRFVIGPLTDPKRESIPTRMRIRERTKGARISSMMMRMSLDGLTIPVCWGTFMKL